MSSMAISTKRRRLVGPAEDKPSPETPRPVTLTSLGLQDVLPQQLAHRDNPQQSCPAILRRFAWHTAYSSSTVTRGMSTSPSKQKTMLTFGERGVWRNR